MQEIAEAVAVEVARKGALVLVGIDGLGGAGKSTLADRLAELTPHSAVVRTDDFAYGWEGGWDWRRFSAQVLEPLLAGRPARYQRFDWATVALADWHQLEPGISALIAEGVSVTRRELEGTWDLTVWVDAPRPVRLRRGLERDGQAALPLWERWMAQEDEWVAADSPVSRCDFLYTGGFP